MAFGQIDESLARNAARRVEPRQDHGATRVHREHPATTEGATRNPSATGTVALVSLKLRAAGRRAASSQVARFHSSDFSKQSQHGVAALVGVASETEAASLTMTKGRQREQCN